MLCLPWPPPCSQPLDIEKRAPRYLDPYLSRASRSSNVKIQLPSFPFGCYTNPVDIEFIDKDHHLLRLQVFVLKSNAGQPLNPVRVIIFGDQLGPFPDPTYLME